MCLCSKFNSHLTRLRIGNPETGTMTNSEDPDKILRNAAFHQKMLCLLKKTIVRKKRIILFETMTCYPSIYTMDHSNILYTEGL